MTQPLTLAEYQAQASLTDQRRAVDSSPAFPLLGLFGETGSLLSEVKKKQRDQVSYAGYQQSVLEEFGDVLWYLAAVADRGHISLAEIGVNLDRSLPDWQADGPPSVSFCELQQGTKPKTGSTHAGQVQS